MDLKEIGWGVWSGFTWLRRGTVGRLLWMRWWTFGFWYHGVNCNLDEGQTLKEHFYTKKWILKKEDNVLTRWVTFSFSRNILWGWLYPFENLYLIFLTIHFWIAYALWVVNYKLRLTDFVSEGMEQVTSPVHIWWYSVYCIEFYHWN
jgi:hypothetical protein